MARKAKKKVEEPPPAADSDVTEEESVHDGKEDGANGDVQMNSDSDDDIPDNNDSGDEGEDEHKKSTKANDKKSKKKDNKKKQSKKSVASEPKMIPFMDTFYQLSSDDSSKDRSIAARDLIHHCFLTEQGVNVKDAAYALTRLMNGLCSGRAASRQGFASCLSSFLRVAYSSSAMEDILKEDEYAKSLQEDNAAAIVRQKLLSTTQFTGSADTNNNKNNKGKKDQKKKQFGGRMKGIEERDHVFGRLFGILAVVRSGVLSLKDFPSEVSSILLSSSGYITLHMQCIIYVVQIWRER